MTEAEWLACDDPRVLIDNAGRKASSRNLRLFACAECRRTWGQLVKEVFREAVEVAERYAIGLANYDELRAMAIQTSRGVAPYSRNMSQSRVQGLAHWLTQHDDGMPTAASMAVASKPDSKVVQTRFLRDIFGNPFRPVTFDPMWRTDTAVALARGMYESRTFAAMPILADALQDAGCEDEQILHHCRDTNQPHVRGCWVCDLVLGL